MRTAGDQRTPCAVHAAPGSDVVPHAGATAACFVDSERARADRRAGARAARLRRAGVAGTSALVARAPRKDHDLCNPPDIHSDEACGAGRAEATPDRRRVAYSLRDALRPISVKRV